MKTYLILLTLIFAGLGVRAQLIIDSSATAAQLAQKLVGSGVTISNPVLNCPPTASGIFRNGNSTQIGISDGVMLTSGTATNITLPYDSLATTSFFTAGDNDLDNLLYAIGVADTMTYDGCSLEFDLKTLGDTLSFTYVFGSEEYQCCVCSQFTDIFGFFISGPNPSGGTYVKQNIALIPGTTLPVSINSINAGFPTDSTDPTASCISLAYSQYFRWDSTICYSGSSVPLTAKIAVLPCNTYHLKLAIADVADTLLDTGVLIAGGSLTSHGLPTVKSVTVDGGLSNAVRGCANATITLQNIPPFATAVIAHLRIGGTSVNGTDYTTLPDSVIFAPHDSLVTIHVSPLSYPGAASGKTVTIYLLSSQCGAAAYDSVTVTIMDSLTLHTSGGTSLCSGNTCTLSAAGVPSCHWTPGATLSDSTILNPVARPQVTTTYTASFTVGSCRAADSVRVTVLPRSIGGPDDTVCLNSPANLSASGSGTWSILPGNPASATITNASSATTTVNGLSALGDYRFIWSSAGLCPDTVHVVVSTGLVLHVNNAAICIGDSAVLTATISNAGGTFTWSPGSINAQSITVSPGITTVYTVTYSNPASSCPPATAPDTVFVYTPPSLSVDSVTICSGGNGVLTATPSETGGSYLWSPGGQTTQSITVSPTVSTSYRVTYSLATCVPVIDSGLVTVATLPLNDSITQISCYGVHSGAITVAVPNCPNCSYQWSDQSIGSSIENLASGSYTVTATSPNGCTVSAAYAVNQPAAASLSITPNNQTVIEDSSLALNTLFGPYPSSSIVSYAWTPSEGLSCSNCPQPFFSAVSGRYTYSLIITYNGSCQVSDTVNVIVASQHIIYIPNSFSPNGDGANDLFLVFPRGAVNYLSLTIFDRWGEKVFDTQDQNHGWDGRFRGELQEPGIYTYLVKITFGDNYSTIHKGSITLIR
jgi:gliding motility-associated-like protein